MNNTPKSNLCIPFDVGLYFVFFLSFWALYWKGCEFFVVILKNVFPIQQTIFKDFFKQFKDWMEKMYFNKIEL